MDILAGGNPDVADPEASAPAAAETAAQADGAEQQASQAPDEPGAGTAQDARSDASRAKELRQEALRRQSAYRASTGLFQTHSASSGPVGSFRFGILTSYMSSTGFLCPQCETFDGGPAFLEDDVSRVGAHVQLSVTPLPYLEAYWAIHSTATTNSLGTPELLQVLGDTTWGVKGFVPVPAADLVSVGGALELWMLNGAGSIGIDNASVALRALGSVDFTKLKANELPIKVNVNLSYVFDNSGNLVEAAEAARRERITRIERFGLNINRVDRFVPAIGVEGVSEYVHPFIEWSVDIPANRQGYQCVVANVGASDQCLENYETFAAAPSRLTLGARGYALLDGLSAIAALDIATGGVNAPFWEEVQPEAPWNLHFGLSYAVDTVPPVVEKVVAPAPPPQRERHVIRGQVVDQDNEEAAVANAVLRYDGLQLTGMVTDEQGRFESRALDPGEYRFQVSATGYEPGACSATVSEATATLEPGNRPAIGPKAPTQDASRAAVIADGDKLVTTLICQLKAKPKVGNIEGVVLVTEAGTPVADAKVTVTDKLGRSLSLQVDEAGAFRFENVPPGEATVRISAAGYLTTTRVVEVPPGQDLRLNLDMVKQPIPPNVVPTAKQILLNTPLEFRTGSKVLLPSAAPLLDELAMVLNERRELARVEVQVHTNNEAPQVVSMQLSQERADVIVNELVQRGIAPERLTAQGYGDSQPVAPHATEVGRRKNERVQIVVLGADEP